MAAAVKLGTRRLFIFLPLIFLPSFPLIGL
jgi:hypothetical protein